MEFDTGSLALLQGITTLTMLNLVMDKPLHKWANPSQGLLDAVAKPKRHIPALEVLVRNSDVRY